MDIQRLEARRAVLVAAITAAALGAACAPVDESYRKEFIKVAASERFPGGGEAVFFEVASRGLLRDTLVVWLSAVGVSSGGERSLAATLSAGKGGLRIVVSGPAPAKTYRVLEGALEANAGRDLKLVHVLFVAPNEYRVSLHGAAEAAGVNLSFMPFSALARAPSD